MSVGSGLEQAMREVSGVVGGIAFSLELRRFSPTQAQRWVAKLRRTADILERTLDGV